ncbi:MAG: amidohydrolase [Clostridia bacterium]
MKILIENTSILTMNDKNELLEQQSIAIEDDKIVFIGEVPKDFQADKLIDGTDKVVMPGLINAHTHIAMSLFRSYADELPLWEWLTEKIWPIEEKLTSEDVYWGSMLSIIEMLQSGITCFNDMYFFEEETAKAVAETGIRARLARGLTGQDASDNWKLSENKKLYEHWHKKADGRITVMFGPHAPYTCSPEYLLETIRVAESLHVGMHIHLSESKKEVEDSFVKYGVSPVAQLEQLGLFELPTIAAHGVHLSDEDMEILAKHQVSIVNNPGSNLKLGNGFAPVEKLLAKGVNVALGTDGSSSNNNLNMFEEINLAALINKGANGNPLSIPAITALAMATKNGAKALGLEAEIGTLEVGKKADLIILDFKKPHLYPKYNIISSLAYSVQASDVETVIINGKIVMEEREIKNINVQQVLEKVQSCAMRLINSQNNK